MYQPLRAKTRQEIALEYGISRRTLHRWLKQENITLSSRLVTPKEQEMIYERFGRTEDKKLTF